jgi:cyanate permease
MQIEPCFSAALDLTWALLGWIALTSVPQSEPSLTGKYTSVILMYMGIVNTGYATSFFIPTVTEQLGFTAQASQVRSIPVFMVAAVLSLTTAWTADRVKHRYTFTMLGVAVATTGYVILPCQGSVSTGVKYFACFLITGGGYMIFSEQKYCPAFHTVPPSHDSTSNLGVAFKCKNQSLCN